MKKIEVTVHLVKQECGCDESECKDFENNLFITVDMLNSMTQKSDDKDVAFHENQIASILHDKIFELIEHVGEEVKNTINEQMEGKNSE